MEWLQGVAAQSHAPQAPLARPPCLSRVQEHYCLAVGVRDASGRLQAALELERLRGPGGK